MSRDKRELSKPRAKRSDAMITAPQPPVFRRISTADQRGWAAVCEALFIYVVARIVPAHRHDETPPSRSSQGMIIPCVGAPPIRAVQVSSQLSRCPYQGRRLFPFA